MSTNDYVLGNLGVGIYSEVKVESQTIVVEESCLMEPSGWFYKQLAGFLQEYAEDLKNLKEFLKQSRENLK